MFQQINNKRRLTDMRKSKLNKSQLSKCSRKSKPNTPLKKSLQSSTLRKKTNHPQIPLILTQAPNENLNINLILPNRQLIKTKWKPDRNSFMRKVSYVYDLIIANIILPPFIHYFLGDAIYRVSRRGDCAGSNGQFEWKLNQFKRECTLIYEKSDEQDIKQFFRVELPSLNRWGSQSFCNSKPSTPIFKKQHFRACTKKSFLPQDTNQDLRLQRLEQKLNNYLENFNNKLKKIS